MRLFVAADVDEHTRAELAAARDAMSTVLARARQAPRVAWVRETQAHLTLRFIGECSDEVARAVREALGTPLGLRAFDVRWGRLGTFPGGRSPRVVWLGPTWGAEELSALARTVNERLAAIVGPGEARPFSPHLTIGRVKDRGREVPWPAALDAARVRDTTTHVDHVTLYMSRLSPKGATYTALCRTELHP